MTAPPVAVVVEEPRVAPNRNRLWARRARHAGACVRSGARLRERRMDAPRRTGRPSAGGSGAHARARLCRPRHAPASRSPAQPCCLLHRAARAAAHAWALAPGTGLSMPPCQSVRVAPRHGWRAHLLSCPPRRSTLARAARATRSAACRRATCGRWASTCPSTWFRRCWCTGARGAAVVRRAWRAGAWTWCWCTGARGAAVVCGVCGCGSPGGGRVGARAGAAGRAGLCGSEPVHRRASQRGAAFLPAAALAPCEAGAQLRAMARQDACRWQPPTAAPAPSSSVPRGNAAPVSSALHGALHPPPRREKLLHKAGTLLPKVLLGISRSSLFLTSFIALAFGGAPRSPPPRQARPPPIGLSGDAARRSFCVRQRPLALPAGRATVASARWGPFQRREGGVRPRRRVPGLQRDGHQQRTRHRALHRRRRAGHVCGEEEPAHGAGALLHQPSARELCQVSGSGEEEEEEGGEEDEEEEEEEQQRMWGGGRASYCTSRAFSTRALCQVSFPGTGGITPGTWRLPRDALESFASGRGQGAAAWVGRLGLSSARLAPSAKESLAKCVRVRAECGERRCACIALASRPGRDEPPAASEQALLRSSCAPPSRPLHG